MPAFVFLEITDRDLNFLFTGIALTIHGTRPIQPTHLTIRGPYSREVPHGIVARCRDILKHDTLRVWDVGRFSNVGEEVVYLRVDSPNLRKVWWKPDYPIGQFGFHPHISLYRGADADLAEALMRYFQHECIDVYCKEFRIVSAVTKQHEMLIPPVPMALYPFHDKLDGRIKRNMLSRLEIVVTRARRKSEHKPVASEAPKG
jgi:hypothetical protein